MNDQPRLEPEQWKEDLRCLANAVENGHPNPFRITIHEHFEAAVSDLEVRLASLERHEIIVGMSALLALVGDGHTSLFLPWNDTLRFRHYPIRLYLFSDGLRVSSAAPAYAKLLGTQLVRIGATRADQALEAVTPLVSRDNAMGLRRGAPECLAVPEVCHALGFVPNLAAAEFTFESNGREAQLLLSATNTAPPRWGRTPDRELPLWLRRADEPFWLEYLPESRTLFVQYNAVRDSPDETVAGFFARAIRFAQEREVLRFVLDLRHNGGGNMDLNQPLIHSLIRSDYVNQHGRLFALIGRQTFSAAMNCAVDLERHTNVLFAGEPTGSSPNFYGETNWTILPNSGVGFSFSSLYWQCSYPNDQRPWIEPNLRAELSSADFLNGHDPVLEAVLV